METSIISSSIVGNEKKNDDSSGKRGKVTNKNEISSTTALSNLGTKGKGINKMLESYLVGEASKDEPMEDSEWFDKPDPDRIPDLKEYIRREIAYIVVDFQITDILNATSPILNIDKYKYYMFLCNITNKLYSFGLPGSGEIINVHQRIYKELDISQNYPNSKTFLNYNIFDETVLSDELSDDKYMYKIKWLKKTINIVSPGAGDVISSRDIMSDLEAAYNEKYGIPIIQWKKSQTLKKGDENILDKIAEKIIEIEGVGKKAGAEEEVDIQKYLSDIDGLSISVGMLIGPKTEKELFKQIEMEDIMKLIPKEDDEASSSSAAAIPLSESLDEEAQWIKLISEHRQIPNSPLKITGKFDDRAEIKFSSQPESMELFSPSPSPSSSYPSSPERSISQSQSQYDSPPGAASQASQMGSQQQYPGYSTPQKQINRSLSFGSPPSGKQTNIRLAKKLKDISTIRESPEKIKTEIKIRLRELVKKNPTATLQRIFNRLSQMSGGFNKKKKTRRKRRKKKKTKRNKKRRKKTKRKRKRRKRTQRKK